MQYVIIGFGVAGFWALKTILKEHSDLQDFAITIITNEASQTYYKCFLADYVSAKNPVHDLSACRSLLEDEHVNVLWRENVDSLTPETQELTLQSGTVLKYDKLLLASGLRCAGATIAKNTIEGVFPFNYIQDARDIKSYIENGCQKAVVVGDNIFGFEIARACLALDMEVTLLCEGDYVAEYLVDRSVASLIEQNFPDNLKIITNTKVNSFVDKDNKVVAVELDDGSILETDMVAVCTPLITQTSYVPPMYLDENGKLPVNEQMMTEIPNVYAAGDITTMWNEPLEFSFGWRRALFQGQVAARTMLELQSWFTLAPAMRVQIFGFPIVLLGKPYSMLKNESITPLEYNDEDKKIKKQLFIDDGQLVAAMLCGNLDKITIFEELILEGAAYGSEEITYLVEYLEPYSRSDGTFIERYCPVCKSVIDFKTSACRGMLFACPICAEVLRVDATIRYKQDLVVHHAVDKLNKI